MPGTSTAAGRAPKLQSLGALSGASFLYSESDTVTNIFVGNLSFDATEADVRTAFERFGHVSSVEVMTDRTTGKPRGFAFVRMPRVDDADEAVIRMNGGCIRGRCVRVNRAEPRESRQPAQTAPSRLHLI
jgi:RNA recognition motif-containing protein